MSIRQLPQDETETRTKHPTSSQTQTSENCEKLSHEELLVPRIDSDDPSIEAIWVSVSIRGVRAATIGAAYRPPDAPMVPALDSLQQQLCQVKSLGKSLYLLGDMNLDVSRPEARGVHRYLQLLDELQLHQLVRETTHPSPTPTTLDHVITNVPPERSSTIVVDDAWCVVSGTSDPRPGAAETCPS
ncbi:hypothetical protein FJT64_025962 [Amphibalanus amphitrite]|uniref:Endonuclease/exonuclease/phosphatase domain-containing protein n=1 Tax=Amphibalanus amphitrite TaxID=1232801 RepID=A0A6A4W723_AMPAM|nr:hypothetical protein FJT64_025962 [Amphibalanus amphitrite]